jgi:hypothetical protein
VHPADQMHSANPPSHPELLDWLAARVKRDGYRLTPLVRGIALSNAYARSSRWDSADKRPLDSLFAVAQVRPLKPWQYGTSLLVASQNPDELRPEDAAAFEKKMDSLASAGRGLGNQFELPTSDFQIGVDEALLFSNSEKIASELLRDGNDRLIGRLAEAKDHREAAGLAVWSVYGRPATEEELKGLTEYLEERDDRPADARRQMVWALLTSSECRFNY